MRWIFWRPDRDTRPEARRHIYRLRAQQSEVDRLSRHLEQRRRENHFREAVEQVIRGRP